MEICKNINRVIINFLIFFTILVYGLFIAYTVFNIQFLNNVSEAFLGKLDVSNALIVNIDKYNDSLVLLGIIPEFIVIVLILIVFRNFEKNVYGRKLVLKLIIKFVFLYFIYVNIFSSGFFTKYVNNMYIYNIIQALLILLFIFVIYYILYSAYEIYKNMRGKSKEEVLRNYENVYFPFLLVFFIILIFSLFRMLSGMLIFNKIIDLISLENLIDITNLPGDIVLSNVVPDFVVDFFDKIFTVFQNIFGDLNISSDDLNSLVDEYVFKNIDNFINDVIFSRIYEFFFNDFLNIVISLILIVIVFIFEYKNILNLYVNFMVMPALGFLIYSFSGFIYNFLTLVSFIFMLLFGYMIFVLNFDQNKNVLNKVQRAVNSLKI